MSHFDAPHYVYRLLGRRGSVLYVGCSMNLRIRLAEHRRNGRYGHLIGRIETEGPYDFETARRVEREQIETRKPRFNVEWTAKHNRGYSTPQVGRRAWKKDAA